MKIVEISAENNGRTGGKKELGAAKKWLFDAEDRGGRAENSTLSRLKSLHSEKFSLDRVAPCIHQCRFSVSLALPSSLL